MLDLIRFMAVPFAAAVVLVGIHGYFGLHVITRNIIFVDIAMAQIAALGATAAFLLHYDPVSVQAYLFSLGFTLGAAVIFTVTRSRNGRIPQEAIIGVVYAMAAAAAIVLIDKAPGGAEHLAAMLSGSLLWVHGREVLTCAAVYLVVGAFHYLHRRTFFAISQSYEEAQAAGIRTRWWDFLFYATFGLVLTHSVRVAGILLVFSYLVIPASVALLFAREWRRRIVIGWSVGVGVSMLGLFFSFTYDLPSGPTIVCLLGATLIVVAVYRVWAGKRRRATLHQPLKVQRAAVWEK